MANPPYGVDWKDFRTQLEIDTSGRFNAKRMPPTSDGQLLFLQHAVHHLAPSGVAVIVLSGSTLFSGDACGGESETRRWLIQEQDMVEAIVQLPKNEFFNTGSPHLPLGTQPRQAGRAQGPSAADQRRILLHAPCTQPEPEERQDRPG